MTSIEFTPMKGLLAIADQLASRLRLGELWNGAEGLRAVTAAKLEDIGVPSGPIQLESKQVTPLQLAQRAGFIRRRRKLGR